MSERVQVRRNEPTAPLRAVRLDRPDHAVDRRSDGTILIRARQPLGPYPQRMTDRLVHWAREAPDRVFFAARNEAGAWRGITYAQALASSTNLIRRAVMLAEPLSLDIGEVTDKGSVNQRIVLKQRATMVEELYADAPPGRVITIEEKL